MYKGSQKTPSIIPKMLRYVAIEVMFRLLMQALSHNSRELICSIKKDKDENLNQNEEKISSLLRRHYPYFGKPSNNSNGKLKFRTHEKMTGHDLMIATIIANSKKDNQHTVLYDRRIGKDEWEKFVKDEGKRKKSTPSMDEVWHTMEEEEKLKATNKLRAESLLNRMDTIIRSSKKRNKPKSSVDEVFRIMEKEDKLKSTNKSKTVSQLKTKKETATTRNIIKRNAKRGK